MRKCSNCFESKPLAEFYTRKGKGSDGYQLRCKACNAEVVAGYRRRLVRKRIAEGWTRLDTSSSRKELEDPPSKPDKPDA